ncbi:MAG: hypothetical protein NUK63_06545 [Candidatus Bathyarchaeum tardum]|nr:MAG: hypothetical protein NUK63_06545 [Candidatus Bathyarchaeum tardum]
MLSRKAAFKEHKRCHFSVSEIVEKYSEWVSEDTYMIFDRLDLRNYEHKTFAIKCSKRGNDVYRKRVYRRFRELSNLANEADFFNPKDRTNDKTTRALFVTLTYDTKRCSLDSAWENMGLEFNCFMAYVRKNIGEVSCCRVFESYENGYPHIHCILLFEQEFQVFRDTKGNFRIPEKDIFSKGWHSHVDVKAVYSLGRGFSYLKKYLLKSIDAENKDSKTLKTLALCWLFNKRAFSVSGKFRKLLIDLIKTKHNSNHKKIQITLTGETTEFFVFAFVGIVPFNILSLTKHQQQGRFIELTKEQTKISYHFVKEKH